MAQFGSISTQEKMPICDDLTHAWDRLDTGKIRKRQVTGVSLVNEGRLDEHHLLRKNEVVGRGVEMKREAGKKADGKTGDKILRCIAY